MEMIHKILSSLHHPMDNISLKKKIIIIFFIFIVLPLSIFTSIAYNNFSNLVYKQTLSAAKQSFDECELVLTRYFKNMNNTMNLIVYSEKLYSLSKVGSPDYSNVEQLSDYIELRKLFDSVKKVNDIDNIRFYLNNTKYYIGSNTYFHDPIEISNQEWYKIIISSKNDRLWTPPSAERIESNPQKDYYSYSSNVYNSNDLKKKLGTIFVDIDVEKVENLLGKSVSVKNSVMFITDGKRVFLSDISIKDNLIHDYFSSSQIIKPTDGWANVKKNNKEYIMNIKGLDKTGWYLVYSIPKNDLFASSYKLRNYMILLMLIIAIVSYVLAYYISFSSLKRLSLLYKKMLQVEEGDLTVRIEGKGTDEIGNLTKVFNKMLIAMSKFAEEKYHMGLAIKSAELNMLQAQINPHFLYNTLDLVNCHAIKHRVPEIQMLILNLSKFYKLSLSHGLEIISIKDELAHVTAYINIQNLRFENRITLEFDLDESLLMYQIPKIILQPLVENSILHGIMEKDCASGQIKISVHSIGGDISLFVEDNGVGMTHEQIASILSDELPTPTINSSGYGVRNTHDRLSLYFGSCYGLSYRSTVGEGTVVEIKIPKIGMNN